MENPAAMTRLRTHRLISSKSCTPTPSPMPMIGPMSGEMSMAPMMTAVELVFSPSDAMNIATMRMSMFVPRNDTPSRIAASASACGTRSSRVKKLTKKSVSRFVNFTFIVCVMRVTAFYRRRMRRERSAGGMRRAGVSRSRFITASAKSATISVRAAMTGTVPMPEGMSSIKP